MLTETVPPVTVKKHHLRDIRTRNRTRLLRLLFSNGALSRHELNELTGLTLASISRITKELISEGICYEEDPYRTDKSLVGLTAAYLPDRIVLAGPLTEAQVYCDAVVESFQEVARDTDSERIKITTNRTTYIQAAQNLALSEYIYSG